MLRSNRDAAALVTRIEANVRGEPTRLCQSSHMTGQHDPRPDRLVKSAHLLAQPGLAVSASGSARPVTEKPKRLPRPRRYGRRPGNIHLRNT